MKGCKMVMAVNGKPSKLYSDLQKSLGNRPLGNLIYAAYLQTGVATLMDALGYSKDKNGEHYVEDVKKFFDVVQMVNEIGSPNAVVGRNNLVYDSTNRPIDFKDVKLCLDKAQDINSKVKGKIASVVLNGDNYNVIIEDRDSRTFLKEALVEELSKIYEAINRALLSQALVSIDEFQDFANDIMNPLSPSLMMSYLQSVPNVPSSALSLKDIKVLMTLNKKSLLVQNAITRLGGDFNTAAALVHGFLHGTVTLAPRLSTFVNNMVNQIKLVPIDLTLLNQDLTNISNTYRHSNPQYKIQDTLDALNKRYGIGNNVIVRKSGQRISTISEALADAILILEKQLTNLENLEGKTAQGKQIEQVYNAIMQEIDGKRYCQGMLSFLSDALKYSQIVANKLHNISLSGTTREITARTAKVLMQTKVLMDSYYPIVKALSNINDIVFDENVSDADKLNILRIAKQVRETLEGEESFLKDLRKENMKNIAIDILGELTYDGQAIASILDMAEADSSIFDYLYSIGRLSNPMLAAMGQIIRDALDERNAKLVEYSTRIKEATNKLRRAEGGSIAVDTSWMYDKDGRVISDIDWDFYNKEYSKYKAILRKQQGLKGFALKEAMDNWVEMNTEEVVVDKVSGRTERIPDSNYRLPLNPVDYLSPALRDYYETMMQIKGELGTLLPHYALKLYIPPQIRKSWIEVIESGIKNKTSARVVLELLYDRMKFWKLREDDTEFASNSITVDGLEVKIVDSDYDNTPLRKIPIFFLNKLKGVKRNGKYVTQSQDELKEDFSGAMTTFATTALNYEAMSSVKETVEFMADFLKDQNIIAKKDGTTLASITETASNQICRILKDRAASNNTQEIITGFISAHLYGQKISEKDNTLLGRIARNLINYSSFKALTVNVKGGIANYLVGEAQMLIETGLGMGGRYYNLKDYAFAHAVLFGDNTLRAPGRIMDFLTNDKNSKGKLLEELFDPMQDVYSDIRGISYHNSFFGLLFGGFNSYGLYASGEYLIHYVTMYAILNNRKVAVNGNVISLYDALKKVKNPDGSYKLEIDPNATIVDKEGRDTGVLVDKEYLNLVKRDIRAANQNTHGSMNDEDKGIIHLRLLGKAVMNFRQWMVEHYSRRYRGRHWDASTRQWEEGYWRTTGKFVKDFVKDFIKFNGEARARWDSLSENDKYNVKKCFAEIELIGILNLLSFALGDPDKHKGEWWTRLWIYEVNRILLDENASTPWGAFIEAKTMVNSPIASVNVVNGFLYPVFGLSDIDDTILRGPYRGWNKYLRNTLKYTVPFWGLIDLLMRLDEDESVFTIFDSSSKYKN